MAATASPAIDHRPAASTPPVAPFEAAPGTWVVVSSDDVSRPKPDPEGVLRASEALGVPVDRILLAGDSQADVTAGRAAGARTAAVLWAAYLPLRLRQAGADHVCQRVEELVAVIDALQAAG